jgi:hypothetical protein|tara:strand:- start:499 stop:687 length:189 start_codon:yes stop_codon:yes gene_type:complete
VDQEFEVKELKIHTDINKVDSEEYEEIGKLEENDLQTLIKNKLTKDGVSADWLDKHLIIMED